MENIDEPLMGHIAWFDLTVPNAEKTRDFYRHLLGWRFEEVEMEEGYSDYVMFAPGDEEPIAGICHKRGVNEPLPPVWLAYFLVDNLSVSMALCVENGGEIVLQPEHWGPEAQMCVVKDPAGAYFALYQKPG